VPPRIGIDGPSRARPSSGVGHLPDFESGGQPRQDLVVIDRDHRGAPDIRGRVASCAGGKLAAIRRRDRRCRESAPRGGPHVGIPIVDQRAQIRMVYEIALSRSPTGEEMRLAVDFLSRQKLVDLTHVLFNLNEFVYVR